MAKLSKVDTVSGNDTLVLSREQDAGFVGALVTSVVTYLNATVSGADGKSLLNGVLPPGVMDGTEGDFWLDTATYDLYGPKAGTDWGLPTSLIGPQGDPGVALVTSVNTYIGAVVLTKADVGLSNVDNTSDANKPVSTAQATSIGLKQDTLVSGTSIKTVNGVTLLGSGNLVTPNAVASVNGYTGVVVLTKNDVGLGNVQNLDTSVASNITEDTTHRFATDAEKATWNAKQAALGFTPVPDTRTVNGVPLTGDVTLTKVNIGLGNVDNTSDADKPVSTLQAGAIALKEDGLGTPAVSGYVLSSTTGNVRSWIPPGGGGGGIPEAPVDGTTYGRKDAGWVAVGSGGGSSPRKATVAVTFADEANDTATIVPDATVTAATAIWFASLSEDLGLQGVTFQATPDPGIGYTVTGYAPDGATGTYNVTAYLQETA